MIVDITTWCSITNRAAISLKNILEEINDESLVKNVGKHFANFAYTTKQINDIKNSGTREKLITLVYKLEIEKIIKKQYPKNVESHLRTTLSTIFKQKLNETRNSLL